jgi:hypothetical protein
VTVPQLVQRSLVELQRLPGARIEPQALAAADARLLDAFDQLGRQGQLLPPEPAPLPRAACDLDAADIRIIDDGWLQAYSLGEGSADGEWQRAPLTMPAALRISATEPAPAVVAVLSNPLDQGKQARLQVRLRSHAVCNGDLHPLLGFSGPHGRWVWDGHAASAASWPVATREQPLPKAGPGSAIAEETSPELQRLEFEVCGLRDEGEVVGGQQILVSVWPATQWWLELARAMPAAQTLLPGLRPWARGITRCRIERDGAAQDAARLKQQFEDGLDAAVAVGVQSLAAAWEALPGLAQPRCEALLGLLVGKAAATWGWRFGAGGLAGPALMRLLARLDLDGCNADLQLGGELALSGTKSRITLHLAGQAGLRQVLRREILAPALPEVMLPAVARWSFPVRLSLEPLASESGCLLQLAGPVTGALVGEAGLRPCTKGSSGWEWFAGLRLEPVVAPFQLTDPLLGSMTLRQPLLPALVLVDWSLG